MTKLLAFIGWLIVTGAAFWWAALENQEGWVFTLISFIAFFILISIFSSNKKENNKETTIVYVQPQNTANKTTKKTTKSQRSKASKKAK